MKVRTMLMMTANEDGDYDDDENDYEYEDGDYDDDEDEYDDAYVYEWTMTRLLGIVVRIMMIEHEKKRCVRVRNRL